MRPASNGTVVAVVVVIVGVVVVDDDDEPEPEAILATEGADDDLTMPCAMNERRVSG